MQFRTFRPGVITVYFGLTHIAILALALFFVFLGLANLDRVASIGQSILNFYEHLFSFLTVRPEDYDKTNMRLVRTLLWSMGFIVGFFIDCFFQITVWIIKKQRKT
jgi:hypothetical protein